MYMEKENNINGLSVFILRIAVSAIFVTAGVSHLLNAGGVVQRIQQATFGGFAQVFGAPYTLGIISGYVLLIFGVAFMLGVFTRWSAAVLFLTLIPITITIQMGNGWLHGPLWKNVALFGGLLFFIVNNPKAYSIYHK